MRKHQLVIIMGVTGAIGSALLEQYGQKKNVVIYGISRKALSWQNFISQENAKLYPETFVCSMGLAEADCRMFIEAIDFKQFSRVTYIHCVGAYLFEIDKSGAFITENDLDEDGINDHVKHLSYDLFRWITQPLMCKMERKIDGAIFGGIADNHEPRIIQSWWRTMEKVEAYMRNIACERIGMFRFNISSVFCPHELITRPFVFIHTDADRLAWLTPHKLAAKVIYVVSSNRNGGHHKLDVFNLWKGYFEGYYTDEYMVPRRIAETG